MTEIEIFKQSLDVSRIAMIITVIMTVISVTFSALNLAFQRSHDRKSVKPLCYINKKTTERSFSIAIENAGLGPMIIKAISAIDPDQKIYNLPDYFGGLQDSNHKNAMVLVGTKDLVIPSNGSKTILEINGDNGIPGKEFEEIRQKLDQTKLLISYRDIYDKRYEVES
jgi:hypothetical protein